MRKTHTPFIATAFLFIALAPGLPYGYFQVLRLVVCACACYVALNAFEKKRNIWASLFIFIAILFNPLVPIYLNREIWIPIDVISGVLFLFSRKLYRGDAAKSHANN